MSTQDLQKTRRVAATIDPAVSSSCVALQRAIAESREESVATRYEAAKNVANEYSMEHKAQ